MPPRPANCVVRLVTGLLLASLTLGLAGCGADAADRTLSRREYIERSNALQREAAAVLESRADRAPATPAEAAASLRALDTLIDGLDALQPPRVWRDEHARMLDAARTMRSALAIISRASPANVRVIRLQLARSTQAQRDYAQAVRAINSTR